MYFRKSIIYIQKYENSYFKYIDISAFHGHYLESAILNLNFDNNLEINTLQKTIKLFLYETHFFWENYEKIKPSLINPFASYEKMKNSPLSPNFFY